MLLPFIHPILISYIMHIYIYIDIYIQVKAHGREKMAVEVEVEALCASNMLEISTSCSDLLIPLLLYDINILC